jgi:hypothetical protein
VDVHGWVRGFAFLALAGVGLNAQDMPVARPIPDAAALTKQVTAHQREMEAVRENYTCHQTTVIESVDGKGVSSTVVDREQEVFFANHHRIARLVKKNGEPLSPAEEASETNRVTKQVEHAMKGAPGQDRSALQISEVLAVSTLSDPHRVVRSGRDTLVFSFVGDPDAQAHGRTQDVGKKLEGTLWVDEADLQVARIEISFYENFNIGGGLLASIQKGSKMEFEQQLVGDHLWMPSVSDQHVAAKIMMFASLRREVHTREFDFKKFDVDSLQDIKPPVQ